MNRIKKIYEKCVDLILLSDKDIDLLIDMSNNDMNILFYYANKLRLHFKKNKFDFCAIINAKSGNCSEDCKFCSQSVKYYTNIDTFPLVSSEKLQDFINDTQTDLIKSKGIVISGKGISDKDFDIILNSIKTTGNTDVCCSLGILSDNQFKKLKDAGIKKFHHNLETSRNFFPNVCTTHSYDDRLNTIKIAQKRGIKICSGGLFGLGETLQDRIDLALELRELNVDSVPLNFLIPVKGTPFENTPPLSPYEILITIALYRFILPDKDIKVCGGREYNLRDLQSWIFFAGANGMMLGNYLTTTGRDIKDDLQMLTDLELIKK